MALIPIFNTPIFILQRKLISGDNHHGNIINLASKLMTSIHQKGNHCSDMVWDKCPVDKGSIRIHIEQRIAAMMGYRGGRLEGDEEKLDDEYEGLWRLGFKGGAFKQLRDEGS
ncbi:hypothetical protein Tco_0280796 [Tanacetum coccineum]